MITNMRICVFFVVAAFGARIHLDQSAHSLTSSDLEDTFITHFAEFQQGNITPVALSEVNGECLSLDELAAVRQQESSAMATVLSLCTPPESGPGTSGTYTCLMCAPECAEIQDSLPLYVVLDATREDAPLNMRIDDCAQITLTQPPVAAWAKSELKFLGDIGGNTMKGVCAKMRMKTIAHWHVAIMKALNVPRIEAVDASSFGHYAIPTLPLRLVKKGMTLYEEYYGSQAWSFDKQSCNTIAQKIRSNGAFADAADKVLAATKMLSKSSASRMPCPKKLVFTFGPKKEDRLADALARCAHFGQKPEMQDVCGLSNEALKQRVQLCDDAKDLFDQFNSGLPQFGYECKRFSVRTEKVDVDLCNR